MNLVLACPAQSPIETGAWPPRKNDLYFTCLTANEDEVSLNPGAPPRAKDGSVERNKQSMSNCEQNCREAHRYT